MNDDRNPPEPKPGDALRALPMPPDLPEDLTLFEDDELEHLLRCMPPLVALCALAGNTAAADKIAQQLAVLNAEAQRRVSACQCPQCRAERHELSIAVPPNQNLH